MVRFTCSMRLVDFSSHRRSRNICSSTWRLNKLPRDVSEKLWIKIRSGTRGIIVTWWIVSIRGKWHGVLATIPWRVADPATHLNRRQPSTGLANTRLLGCAKTTREFADSREDLVIVARNWTLRLVTYAHSKLQLFSRVAYCFCLIQLLADRILFKTMIQGALQ